MPVPSSINLAEKLSASQSWHGGDTHDYDGVRSPNIPGELENGALRPGAPPNYTSLPVLGLLAQYVSVGLLYGALPNLAYPLFTAYFRMSGARYNAATSLVSLGWSLKVFVGILSDCVPIFGYRRKSWMMVGWTLCLVCMLVLAIQDHGSPYITNPALSKVPIANWTEAQKAADLHKEAPHNGSMMAIVFGVATMCYIIADVPADALVVELAQREPEATRGRMQSLIYTTRTVSSVVAQIIIGLGLNSPPYGGSYASDIGMNTVFIVLAVPCAAMVPITFFFVEDKPLPRVSFRTYLDQFWQLLIQRATWQVMLFNFFFNLFASGITSTAAPYVKLTWAQVENLNIQLMTIVSNLLFAGALAATGRWGTMWNWRFVIVVTTLLMNGIDACVQFLTIYDVIRNQWFYLGVPLAEQLPYAMQFIVTTFVIVELAEVGNEGVTYGLLTTVNNLPTAFGPLLANIIFGSFNVSDSDLQSDTMYARNQVAYTYMIYYATTVVACFWVVLLPSQKEEVHFLKMNGGYHPIVGGLVVAGTIASLTFSIVVSILSMFDSTSCSVVAGGTGC
ncbi:Folate-Biopterin Transporter (FBT) Family [Thraustotheca clavata]|uniref:Folate-Biopterin Transporter (FBT) Family n=1 Tax=Thraustotheca clavata TaxID=74557 RepID=A0A1W0A4H0_9STRA|nr:Folate-Biopterin Transporter (FBT) Family [Thraustotheca clavata]